MPESPKIDENFLKGLAETHGTPLVVYSEATLRTNARKLLSAIPSGARLAYSIKANPNPFILRTVRDAGLIAEAASEGEFRHALESGFAAREILLGGPGMPKSALRTARRTGARAILLESEGAIARAKRLGIIDVPVLIRVNPQGLESDTQTRMTGMASPFGIDESSIPSAIALVLRLGLDYAGLFLYLGTQAAGADAIAANTRHLLALDERLAKSGLPCARVLNFGGGFPVPESAEQPSLDLNALCIALADLGASRPFGKTEMIFESGRFLIDDAAVLLTRILDLKVSRGQHFAILDAGINVLGLRQLRYRTYAPELRALSPRPGLTRPVTFVGPTCTPIDVVAEDTLMPPLREGDLLSLPRFGAYSVNFSPTAFCGQGYPAEVAICDDGGVVVTRLRPSNHVGAYLIGPCVPKQ